MKTLISKLVIAILISFAGLNAVSAVEFTDYPSCENSVLDYRMEFNDAIYSTSVTEKFEQDSSTFALNLKKLFKNLDRVIPDVQILKEKITLDYTKKICSLKKDDKESFLNQFSKYVFYTEGARIELYQIYALVNFDSFSKEDKAIISDSIGLPEYSSKNEAIKQLLKDYNKNVKEAKTLYKKIKP